mgnify:CR=1 FL=1
MRKFWTLEDDTILTEMAQKGVKLSKISKTLDRTENAIRLRCKKLGIKPMVRGRHWTKDEETQFIDEWSDEDVTNDYMVRKHKRTWHALQEKASELGLGGRPDNSQYVSVKEICEEMNVSSDRVYSWIKLGLKTRKANNYRSRYAIDIEDLLAFLKDHQNLFNAANVSIYLFSYEPKWFTEKRKVDVYRDLSNHQMEWTNAADKMLLLMFERGISISEMAAHFKRSESAIITHLNVLGCSRKSPRAYTDAELSILYEYSDKKTLQELSEMLPGRSAKGLEYKCKALALPYHLSAARCN